MKEEFQYVRDVYRNCLRILISADLLMEERQFQRYNWAHIYDMDPIENKWRNNKLNSITDADALLSGILFRQYYAPDQKDKDIVTICAVPWRRYSPESFQPVCTATRFSTKNTQNDVYWIGAMPIWEKENQHDGVVHEYEANSGMLSADYRQIYDETVVNDKKLIGISVPLEDIKSSEDIRILLIEPLLKW